MDMDAEARREAMLAELRADLEAEEIPEEALTVVDAMRLLSVTEDRARDWLNGKAESGAWRRAKRGQVYYYWKVRDGGGNNG
jgi:hypothetical protein